MKKRIAAPQPVAADGSVRLSVTIPSADYVDLRRTASNKRVSVAWVIRDAIHEYLRNQTPLLRT